MIRTGSILRSQACTGRRTARAWFKNSNKKAFVIIPKSAKFMNVFFCRQFPIYGIDTQPVSAYSEIEAIGTFAKAFIEFMRLEANNKLKLLS